METGELLKLLGNGEDSKLCIISCDNLGFSHSFNVGIFEALRTRAASCARIIIGAPWSREVTSLYRGEDIGVALTFTSNHPIFRIAPLTQSPTLIDGAGEFPTSRNEFWEHADTDEVRRECRAQIERAIFYGFDPSHLSSEAQALTLRPEFFDVLLDVALEFGLPLRIPTSSDETLASFPVNQIAASEGIISPTHQIFEFDREGDLSNPTLGTVEDILKKLSAGVTELSFRPSIASDELNSLMGDNSSLYTNAHDLLTSDNFVQLLKDYSIKTIGYRELKFAQSELADRNE